MAIPGILLAIALMALVSASVRNVIIALTIPEIPRVVRVVRASVLSLRELPFVEAMRAAGADVPRILLRHIMPNTSWPDGCDRGIRSPATALVGWPCPSQPEALASPT